MYREKAPLLVSGGAPVPVVNGVVKGETNEPVYMHQLGNVAHHFDEIRREEKGRRVRVLEGALLSHLRRLQDSNRLALLVLKMAVLLGRPSRSTVADSWELPPTRTRTRPARAAIVPIKLRKMGLVLFPWFPATIERMSKARASDDRG